jgi:hypothetical protein
VPARLRSVFFTLTPRFSNQSCIDPRICSLTWTPCGGLEFEGVLSGEPAGTRDDLRRGFVSPEEDHDDPCANDSSPCADERAVRIPLGRATAEETVAYWLAVLALVPPVLPPDHHRAAHDRQDDSTHP